MPETNVEIYAIRDVVDYTGCTLEINVYEKDRYDPLIYVNVLSVDTALSCNRKKNTILMVL
jgi:ferredoxin-fold anticodon binding domain-containing protein